MGEEGRRQWCNLWRWRLKCGDNSKGRGGGEGREGKGSAGERCKIDVEVFFVSLLVFEGGREGGREGGGGTEAPHPHPVALKSYELVASESWGKGGVEEGG